MTTEAERRVPEHPGWMPSMIWMVEFDGRAVCMFDEWYPFVDEAPPRWWRHGHRYHVAERDVVYRKVWTTPPERQFDSLAEAKAAFELACERLREGA